MGVEVGGVNLTNGEDARPEEFLGFLSIMAPL